MTSHLGLLIYYTVCIVLGIVLAKLIEQPSLRLRDYLSNSRTGVNISTAANIVAIGAAKAQSGTR